MPERKDYQTTKVRVEAQSEESEKVAGLVADVLEKNNYEVLEWSRPFPIRTDIESGLCRSYVTAVKKGSSENEQNG